MSFVFQPHAVTAVPIVGESATFPVHRVYCVGRNYAAHAREMGKDPEKEPPFFFLKPADGVVPGGGDIHYPPGTKNYHHEIELVVAIGKGGRRIPVADAPSHILGYAVGLDMTRRDLQFAARDLGRPWDFGKSFDESAPIGPIHRAAQTGHPTKGAVSLEVNGEVRQKGDLADLIWSVPETISFLSDYYTLVPGDLIFTGTPAGVAAVVPGDKLVGKVEGFGTLEVTIIPAL
ncbi:MAG: fumarylacetoacetate hydrolase family protein [Burkholderiales bacterium]|jgi:fumarylpyruvate hydrolase|nr:fumarylacetoacetate hydrolase family protein [Burkholderiales bacterium]